VEHLEEADNSYWASQTLFSAWEAAFLTCNLEPFDEPFELSSLPPEEVKIVRQRLLSEVPNLRDGTSIPSQGWSCRSERPVSTTGKLFRKKALLIWAQKQPQDVPPFLI
jgi:hypothetical protein